MTKIITKTTGAREATLATIKALTGQANVLTIPREFINYTGSLDCALFLSQLLYWSDRAKRADGFIYKTYGEWKQEIHLSEYEIKKAAALLESKGILERKLKKANGSPTVHYRLDLDRFSETFLNFLQEQKRSNCENQAEGTEESLTETTTETTTEREREEVADATTPPSFFQSLSPDDLAEKCVNLTTNATLAAKLKPTGRPVPLPEDFQPDAEMYYWAATNFKEISIGNANTKFINHHRAKGTKLVDWRAAWRKWIAAERPSTTYWDSEDEWMEKCHYEGWPETLVQEYMEAVLENYYYVERSEIESAIPDLSKKTIAACLDELVNGIYKHFFAMPAPGYYCELAYFSDPEHKREVDEQLKAIGVEPVQQERPEEAEIDCGIKQSGPELAGYEITTAWDSANRMFRA